MEGKANSTVPAVASAGKRPRVIPSSIAVIRAFRFPVFLGTSMPQKYREMQLESPFLFRYRISVLGYGYFVFWGILAV
jgi:hypothetical protein